MQRRAGKIGEIFLREKKLAATKLTWSARAAKWWSARALSRADRIAAEGWPFAAIFGTTALICWASIGTGNPGGVFSRPESLTTLLSTLAQTLGSIVGIAVAVILVAFQSLRSTYAGVAFRETFRGRALRQLVATYLTAIALSLFSLSTITSPVSPVTIALSYLAIGLFVACLLVLYPSIKTILSGTRIDAARIKQLAAAIDDTAVDVWTNPGSIRGDTAPPTLEDHPLFVLSEIGIRSVIERDRVTPRLILLYAGQRLAKLLEERAEAGAIEDTRDLLGAFLAVFKPVAKTAIEQGDERTLVTVIATMGSIDEFAAKLHVPWYCLIEFESTFQELAVSSARNGSTTAARRALSEVEAILDAHLRENVSPESELRSFNWGKGSETIESDPDAENQWHHVSTDYVDMITKVIEGAVEAGDSEGVSSGLHALGVVVQHVERIETLGVGQKERIIGWTLWHAEELLIKAATKLGTMPILGASAFDAFKTSRALEENLPWSKLQLRHLCHASLRLAEHKRLEWHLLNELGTIGRGCVADIGSGKLNAEAIILIGDTLGEIARIYQSTASSGELKVLKEVVKQLESLERWANGKLQESQTASEHVSRALAFARAILPPPSWGSVEMMPWPDLPDTPNTDAPPGKDRVDAVAT
jgi:hypothetical protein